jgi:hypothetical protein
MSLVAGGGKAGSAPWLETGDAAGSVCDAGNVQAPSTASSIITGAAVMRSADFIMQTRLYFEPINDKQSGAHGWAAPFPDLPCRLSESPYGGVAVAARFASALWYPRQMNTHERSGRPRVSNSVALLVCAMLAACGGKKPPPLAASPATAAAPAPATPPASWNGQWNGPEGTFLKIEGNAAGYQITVRNLDGARMFPGIAAGALIQFERDGVKEMLHASNGAETGMKWLADKSDCLTVRSGEGYCRD